MEHLRRKPEDNQQAAYTQCLEETTYHSTFE